MAQATQKSNVPRITWDEATIAEHDKERGTRMKITEVDTPFLIYEPEPDTAITAVQRNAGESPNPADIIAAEARQLADEMASKARAERKSRGLHSPIEAKSAPQLDFNELTSRLEAHSRAVSSGKCDESPEESEEAARKRKAAFKAKRKAHYNEFKMAKLLANQIMDSNDEEGESADCQLAQRILINLANSDANSTVKYATGFLGARDIETMRHSCGTLSCTF